MSNAKFQNVSDLVFTLPISMSGSILAQKAPISCDTGSSFYVNVLTFVIFPISLDDYKTFQKTKHYYFSISL